LEFLPGLADHKCGTGGQGLVKFIN
jgi:hypothetical protein